MLGEGMEGVIGGGGGGCKTKGRGHKCGCFLASTLDRGWVGRETGTETHMAIFPGVPQHTATHCNTLQHIAKHCNNCTTLQHIGNTATNTPCNAISTEVGYITRNVQSTSEVIRCSLFVFEYKN